MCLWAGAVTAAGLTVVPGTVLRKAFEHTPLSDKLNITGIEVGGLFKIIKCNV